MISEMVMVPVEGAVLAGDLVVPRSGRPVVLCAHGGVSFRNSPRNRAVAHELRKAGLGTLLLDLLTEREERADAVTARHRLEIPRLAGRLTTAIDWLDRQPDTARVPVGLIGSGTAAAAALRAAVDRPERVYAVVSLSGRPDLADDALERVRVPVLLIVGGNEQEGLRLSRAAEERLRAPHEVHVVPGATHLFEDPEALEEVAAAARDRFLPTAVGG